MKIVLLSPNPDKPEPIGDYSNHVEGMRIGDIKPTILNNKGGWNKVFPGRYLT